MEPPACFDAPGRAKHQHAPHGTQPRHAPPPSPPPGLPRPSPQRTLPAGFGTILSTAFIHMLLPANANLSSPCLSEGWNEAYEAWAYMFVVVAIVFMQVGLTWGI